MNAPRNPRAALDLTREVLAALTEPRLTLFGIVARCRMRDRCEFEQFTDGEVRELVELANMDATLPGGAAGEAAMSYLLAFRRGANPVPAAGERLQALGGTAADFDALGDWLGDLGARHMAAAARLETELATREAAK